MGQFRKFMTIQPIFDATAAGTEGYGTIAAPGNDP